jgi:23S rRNA (guanosine2251-2'-O)-methyltransferase
MAIAKVPNIARCIDELKEKGVWIFAAEAGGEPYYKTDFKCGCAIVLGSEGDGVSRLVCDKSDYIVSIPMYGKVNSFNVSTAAAIILAEVSRQHRDI